MRPNLTHLIEVLGRPLIQIEEQNDYGGFCSCLDYRLYNLYASLSEFNKIQIIGQIGSVPYNDTDLELVAVAYDSAGEAVDKSFYIFYTNDPCWRGGLFGMCLEYPNIGLSKIAISPNLLKAKCESDFVDPTTGPD